MKKFRKPNLLPYFAAGAVIVTVLGYWYFRPDARVGVLGIIVAVLVTVTVFIALFFAYLHFSANKDYLAQTRKERADNSENFATESPKKDSPKSAPVAAVAKASTPTNWGLIVPLAILAVVVSLCVLSYFGLIKCSFGSHELPYHSSVAFGNGSSQAVTPDAPVSGSIQAPANGSYDPMDDAKTMEGTFSAPITLISQRGLARKLSFNEGRSQPDPSPADVPWIAKCWPVGGGDPFIWNGSNAVSYDHCAFASKTDQPVKVDYWLIDD